METWRSFVLLLFVLLLFVFFGCGTCLKCNPKDNCSCFPGLEIEFQCPRNYDEVGGFVIHIKDDDFLLDCYSNNKTFDMTLLPNVTLDGIENFRIRFCPLPESGFKPLLDWFSLKEIKFLQFANADLNNVILTKNYFQGLDFLQRLSLDTNGLIDLEEDVFANTPNLISLELKTNRLKLESRLFTYTPNLRWLDLAQNELDSLPEGIFASLNKLESLHLWDNELHVLEDHTFTGLTNLKSLELSANKIEQISENAFAKLSNLKEINMSKNRLTSLAPNTFSRNKNIEMISLNNNGILSLLDYQFSNLTLLEEVDLGNCKINSISDNLFENSVNIKIIKINGNNLTRLPKELFKGLHNIEKLYLFNNDIQSVQHEFKRMKQLNELFLQNNSITEIGADVFKDLINLENITLQHNAIRTIHYHAFTNNFNLKNINLSHNRYASVNSSFTFLESVPQAQHIDLSHNMITNLEDVIYMSNKIHLKDLDLSHNHITTVNLHNLQPLNTKLTVNLKSNNITVVNFDYLDLIASSGEKTDIYSNNNPFNVKVLLSHNPLNCDCENYDLVKYMNDLMIPEIKVMYDIRTNDLFCANPSALRETPIKDVPPELWTCPLQDLLSNDTGCPDVCGCSWRPMDSTIIVDCSNRDLFYFPSIGLEQMNKIPFNQFELHFENNYLNNGPNSSLRGYDNATKLFFSNNQINTLRWVPPNIRVLHLDNNELTHLNYDVLRSLSTSNLVSLTLNNNSWSCDCDALNLTKFLRAKQIDSKEVFCANTTKLLIEQNRSDLCLEWPMAYTILIVVSFFLVIAIFVAAYYCYKQEIKVWLYAHSLCLWWVTEEELDKDKIYDAFISYSHKDEEFVVQNLLPVLEGGPNPYKLCLHYRNWIPGEFITTQVTSSVLESRRTLVVLSPNFLESVWGKMEFRTAHTHAMTEGRARVIIVLHGDVDVDKLDDELKTYMKTNTYVKWGDPYFWNKLKYALPHSRGVLSNKQKIANVMNCIDDKFTLVAPEKPSPGSTPPALVLDSGKLRKHPLNFIPNSESETPPAESGNLILTTGL